jgi:tetratricopeptide (TPR) repeat protein
VLFLVSCGPSAKERAQQQYNTGIKMMYKSKHSQALTHFNKALELNPELLDAKIGKAKVFINQAKYREAVEILDEVIEKADNLGQAYNTRAQAKFYLGDKMGSCVDWQIADQLGIPNIKDKIRHCP